MSMLPHVQPFSLDLKRLEIYKDEYFVLSLPQNCEKRDCYITIYY